MKKFRFIAYILIINLLVITLSPPTVHANPVVVPIITKGAEAVGVRVLTQQGVRFASGRAAQRAARLWFSKNPDTARAMATAAKSTTKSEIPGWLKVTLVGTTAASMVSAGVDIANLIKSTPDNQAGKEYAYHPLSTITPQIEFCPGQSEFVQHVGNGFRIVRGQLLDTGNYYWRLEKISDAKAYKYWDLTTRFLTITDINVVYADTDEEEKKIITVDVAGIRRERDGTLITTTDGPFSTTTYLYNLGGGITYLPSFDNYYTEAAQQSDIISVPTEQPEIGEEVTIYLPEAETIDESLQKIIDVQEIQDPNDLPELPTYEENPYVEEITGSPLPEPGTGSEINLDRFFDDTKTIDFQPMLDLGADFTNKFPFSLPWDLKRSIESLNMQGSLTPINLQFYNPVGEPIKFTVEWPDFVETYAVWIRSGFLLIYTISLIWVTSRFFGGQK